jgi:mRNA interferase YafQ
MMYKILYTTQFKKSLKLCAKRGLSIDHIYEVINILSREGKLPNEYKPHKLSGKYKGFWECHIEPDWLLIWGQNDRELTLLLVDTGTHSDLF